MEPRERRPDAPSGIDSAELDCRALGVYAYSAVKTLELVHDYQGGDFSLQDVFDEFSLGSVEPVSGAVVAVAFNKTELRRLKVSADAYSFDYDEEFIAMCLALHRYALSSASNRIVFCANFG